MSCRVLGVISNWKHVFWSNKYAAMFQLEFAAAHGTPKKRSGDFVVLLLATSCSKGFEDFHTSFRTFQFNLESFVIHKFYPIFHNEEWIKIFTGKSIKVY